MKTLLLLSLVLLVSCNGGAGSSTDSGSSLAPTAAATPVHTITRTDGVVSHKTYDVTNGGMSYYTSQNTLTDSDVFTIPATITLNTNSTNSIVDGDNYMDMELVGRISCVYYKSGNTFTFDHCTSYAASVYWDIQPGDVYTVTDLNADSAAIDSHKINVVLYSQINTPRNGHINFSYDL